MGRRPDNDSNFQDTVTREVYNAARAQADQELAQIKAGQADRERLLSHFHQAVGQIKTANMFAEFAQVSGLVWIQQMRDTKAYKEFGTWEEFCEYIGFTRQHIEDQLKNLAAFGEKFTQTVCALGVGYRDLRKLRQLTHDGTVTIDADAVVIGADRIPLDQDHREDLQAAIEKIIDEQAQVKAELSAQKKAFDRVQDDTRKSMTKLQKELDKFTAQAEAKGLTADEDAFMQRMEVHRTMIQGSMIALEPIEITKEFMDLSPRMVARVISLAHEVKMQALALYDTLVSEIGNSVMNPEMIEDFARWEQENGFTQ